jgi:hypothetical protein
MTINLFVGDDNYDLAEQAQKHDPTAFLIEHSNYKQFLTTTYTKNITVYTCIRKLPETTYQSSIFFEILSKVDNIFYCPPVKWSDYADEFVWENLQITTEYFLHHINLIKNNVQGLDLTSYHNFNYLDLVESRKTSDRQIWVSGCSIFHGVGVEHKQKVGSLISQNLDLPVSHITKGGSSIEWAKDQILRSDIRKNDIVVWGLTQEVRAPKAINKKVMLETDPDTLLDETSLYRAVTSVYQVVNFCKKISARLILVPIICSKHLELTIHKLDECCQFPYHLHFLDYGTDKIHPGPLQHQEWATGVCERLLKD